MSNTSLPQVNTETAAELGLNAEEFEQIKDILGRTPNYTELSIFSVMWSEHCSYKNSIKWLKTLPKDGPAILAKAGEENAGLVGLGGQLACAFKIESHNHPSAIEPFQGAATGVGGIHRDIFTMGARPIAALNSLRFGNIELPKTKWLVKGVVKGIGSYGNSFGVPTIGGEVYFDESYNINPLVNAMSVGIVDKDKTISAISKGAGNPVYIVGSATGKDGIHGATFASEDIDEDSADKIPSVQVGDPFQEKLLLEATLEAIKTGAIVGMQDMGAAGITCSTSEMSEKGEHGMRINLDKVPTRQKNMEPFEILLSESQERMLVVVEKGREKDIETVFEKWDLNCEVIGEVTEGDNIEFYHNGNLVAQVPAPALVLGGGAPIYNREYTAPKYLEKIKAFLPSMIIDTEDYKNTTLALMGLPNIASKKWVYEQYDSMVRTDNISTNKASAAPTIRIKDSDKALAVSVDCNPYYVYADPKKGTSIAVSEAARNIVCSGGKPMAITNCLNFGNPYNPEVYWQFVNAIKGMSEACETFSTPVTGGNVSFYNQSSDEGPVFPTPTIGMIGLIDNLEKHMGMAFENTGDLIYMLGKSREDINSSQYLIHIKGEKHSPAPFIDLEEEQNLQSTVLGLIDEGLINSANDISDGGLITTLIESALINNLGFSIKSNDNIRKDAFLFGESQSRVIITVNTRQKDKLEEYLKKQNQDFESLGIVTTNIQVDNEDWGSINEFRHSYEKCLEDQLG